ncbi:hypothetical protein ABRQ22_17165 [Cellulosimicrobium sp. ES-005]|uniref:Uncharacterized protein n=1 Tax=Cellulosimicrobium sp. ES-005 TaxID=3163031 RepID=A0AAU8FXE2_9MICO
MRELHTPAEVETLPRRSVIRDAHGTVAENAGGPEPWLPTGYTEGLEAVDLAYPVLVLWEPTRRQA